MPSMLSPESVQRFNAFVDDCFRGTAPFQTYIEGEREIAAAQIPLPDQIYVNLDANASDDLQRPGIMHEYSVTAERHLSTAKVIRRLHLLDRTIDSSHPYIFESTTDQPGITFRIDNSSFSSHSYSIEPEFLEAQLDRIGLGIQLRQAGY